MGGVFAGCAHVAAFEWRVGRGGVHPGSLGSSLTTWSFLHRKAKPGFLTWLPRGKIPQSNLPHACGHSLSEESHKAKLHIRIGRD